MINYNDFIIMRERRRIICVKSNGVVKKRYEEIPFSDESFPIRILWEKELSRSFDGSDASDTWHEQLEILYMLSGGAEVECGYRRFIAEDGDIVIINPCEVHSVIYNRSSPKYHCVMIDPKLYTSNSDISGKKYIEQISNRRVQFNNLIRENQTLRRLTEDMIGECRDMKTAYEIAVKGYIMLILAELFRSELRAIYTNEEIIQKTRGYERIAPALRLIAEFYTRDLSLGELSKACCLDTSYFCRRFKEITGRTAVSYINSYRVAKADALLITTDMSIGEIAAAVGFSDGSYFCRAYKAMRGRSPSAMRKADKETRLS